MANTGLLSGLITRVAAPATRWMGGEVVRFLERHPELVQRFLPADLSRTTEPVDPARRSLTGEFLELAVEGDRLSAISDCWTMYLTDPVARRQIEAVAASACAPDRDGHPFRIQPRAEGNEDFWRRIGRKIEEPGLAFSAMGQWRARDAMVQGNAPHVMVADDARSEIVELRALPGPREGMIARKLRDFVTGQLAGWGLFDVNTQTLVRFYSPVEIVDFTWCPTGSYGLPLFSSDRVNWRRLEKAERDMSVARGERAYSKLAHIFPNFSPEQLRKFIAEFEQMRKERPVGPETDHFATGDVKVIDPSNAQLQHIPDVEYFQKKHMDAGMYPVALLPAHGEGVNRATLEMQVDQMIETAIHPIRNTVATGYRKVIETQMILYGADPDDLEYDLIWTSKSSATITDRATGYGQLVDRGAMTPQSYAEEFDLDWDEELRRKEAAEKLAGAGTEPRVSEELLASLSAWLDSRDDDMPEGLRNRIAPLVAGAAVHGNGGPNGEA
jgi:hypothetical protein